MRMVTPDHVGASRTACHRISTANPLTSKASDAKEAKISKLMKTLTLTLAALAMAAPVWAKEPLATEQHINDSLRAGRIGDVIRKNCPSVSARMFVVLGKLEDLKAYAVKAGYTEDEVRAFMKDPKEKARLKAEADAYLKKAGAKPGDSESYCKVGRDEIAKKSLIGSLLRSR